MVDSGGSGRAGFGPRLQAWRREKRLTQFELSERLGYNVTYIAKIEGGTRPASRAFLSVLSLIADTRLQLLIKAVSMGDIARPMLPQAPDELIGRDEAVGAVARLLEGQARCVTLVGAPGIGKSRLAAALAQRFDDVFVAGAWWVSLVDALDADEVVARLRRALGITETSALDPLDAVVSRLHGQQALVVFDNFETIHGAESVVGRLIADAAQLKVLVTSREPLEVLSEHVFPVRGLSFPDPKLGPAFETVRDCDAVKLFVARATMANPEFRLTPKNYGAVLRLCARLGGVPLGLVLVAGAVTTVGADRLADRLDVQLLDVIFGAPTDVPPRHKSLELAIGWSWDRLSGDQQRVLEALAVFAGGFTAGAVAAVTEMDVLDAEENLAVLLRTSLVEADPEAPGGARFTFLPTIRAFASRRLEMAGRASDARRDHAAYFAAFAETAGRRLVGSEQVRCAHAFDDEFENLKAAFDWSTGNDPEQALRIASSSWRFFVIRDLTMGREWLRTTLRSSGAASAARATAMAAAGALCWMTGQSEAAAEYLDGAQALAEQLGLPEVTGLVLVNRGALGEQQDRLDVAEDRFQEALAHYDRLEDRRGRAVALNGLGMVHRRRGEVAEAWPLWTEAASLFRAVGDGMNEAIALGNMAWFAETTGDPVTASAICDECRNIQIAIRDARGLAATTAALGRLAFARGDIGEARSSHLEALGAFRTLGDLPWLTSTLVALSAIMEQVGSHESAVKLVAAAVSIRDEAGLGTREDDQRLVDGIVGRCRRSLGEVRYDRVWTQGRYLSVDDAVELANKDG